MNVRIKDTDLYQVGNPAEGTAYVVNMHNTDHDGTMTCTCPHYRFRAQEGEHRACKHIQRVIQVSPSEITVDRLAYQQLVREYEILSGKIDSVSQDLTRAQANGASAPAPSQPQESGSVPASDAAGDGQQMAEVSAEEAAEKLQQAYDEQVSGMEVHVHDGVLWPNNTSQAPDWVFDAFLKKKLEWDKDGRYDHPHVGPNNYELTNYLEPSDVEQYISEVLE